jgi:Collagen triple helix repeat (20 copies)
MRKLAAVVFCLVCAQGTVNAQYRQNVITSAVVDKASGLVLVAGQFGWNPLVTINGMTVHVMSASSQMMVVELPASLLDQPGAYLLTVSTGSGSKQTTFFEITVGAVGPQGPRGADGASGAKGDPGPAGATGDKGDKGDKGDPGAAGAAGGHGDKGDKGDRGDKGDKGDPGTPGTNGTNGLNGTNGAKGDKGDTGPAGAGALHVADAAGTLVGTFMSPNAVIVNVNGDWVQLKLTGAAFSTCSSATQACGYTTFEEKGCAGTEYMEAGDTLVQNGLVIDGAIRYPSGPVQARSIWSYRVAGSACVDLDVAGTETGAAMKSAPVSSLELSGAFHLAR